MTLNYNAFIGLKSRHDTTSTKQIGVRLLGYVAAGVDDEDKIIYYCRSCNYEYCRYRNHWRRDCPLEGTFLR